MKAKKIIKRKELGEKIVISIGPTIINPKNYDVYINEGNGEYCLLQCVNHGTRRTYQYGTTLNEAEELYDLLQKPEDIHLIRGELSSEDYIEAEKLWLGKNQEVTPEVQNSRDYLIKKVKTKISPFVEKGKRYFSNFDRFMLNE